MQVLEVDAVVGQPAKQRGDAGFLRLHVQGGDQGVAAFAMLLVGLAAIMRDVTKRFEEMRALKRKLAGEPKGAPG